MIVIKDNLDLIFKKLKLRRVDCPHKTDMFAQLFNSCKFQIIAILNGQKIQIKKKTTRMENQKLV